LSTELSQLVMGTTLGILGGGQLGRMTAMAAARLGIRCVVWTPDADSPASQVAAETIVAPWDDSQAVTALATKVDVVTLEFENVPLDAVRALAAHVSVRPGARCLEVAQDRLLEKSFANDLAVATAPYRQVGSVDELGNAFRELGGPAILKSRRLGYDGKGQMRLNQSGDGPIAWKELGGVPCILEGFVPFEKEVSVIVARGVDGVCRAYDVVENQHENHILRRTLAPAVISAAVASQAQEIGARLASALDLVGLLAVEFFLLGDGTLMVNEIAPRPHNSGHWTIDGCSVSQFEQLVRAVMDMPLGDPTRHSDAEMVNLLGDESTKILEEPFQSGTCVHLYGKSEARAGRKMGHVTTLRPRT
jgi:5-(carboxyamino)imidazole ribonucleotide synthase